MADDRQITPDLKKSPPFIVILIITSYDMILSSGTYSCNIQPLTSRELALVEDREFKAFDGKNNIIW